MKVLVTGASGFLGGHVAEALSARGDHVRALVRKTSNRKHLETLPNVELFEGSVEQVERVREAVDGVDAIVHCAGIVKAREHRRVLRRQRRRHVEPRRGGARSAAEPQALRPRLEPRGVRPFGRRRRPSPPTRRTRSRPTGGASSRPRRSSSSAQGRHARRHPAPRRPSTARATWRSSTPSSRSSGASSRVINGGRSKSIWIYATDCAEACVRAIDADVPSGARVLRRRRVRRDRRCSTMFADFERALGKKALVRASLPMPRPHDASRAASRSSAG